MRKKTAKDDADSTYCKRIGKLINQYFLAQKGRALPLNPTEQVDLNEWINQSTFNKDLFERFTDEDYRQKIASIDVNEQRRKIYQMLRQERTGIIKRTIRFVKELFSKS